MWWWVRHISISLWFLLLKKEKKFSSHEKSQMVFIGGGSYLLLLVRPTLSSFVNDPNKWGHTNTLNYTCSVILIIHQPWDFTMNARDINAANQPAHQGDN